MSASENAGYKNNHGIRIMSASGDIIDAGMNLGIKKVYPDAQLPTYAHIGDACFDIRAYMPEGGDVHLCDDYLAHTFETGLSFEIPPGYALMIYSRSGHGFSYDVSLSNGTGLIDSGYKGQVKVRLAKHKDCDGSHWLRVKHGDRIAQAMLIPILTVNLVEVDQLSDSERGTNGFGSTGNQ